MAIKLTPDQDRVVREVLDFIRSDKTTHTLAGAAGTGKTTTLKEIVKQVPFLNRDIRIAAPTHRAKNIATANSDVEGSTLAADLGLMPNTQLPDYDALLNNIFEQIQSSRIPQFMFYIPDEASQIGNTMFEMIRHSASKGKTKVLFIGDSYQLPPVSNDVRDITSPCFDIDKVGGISYLHTPIRQQPTNPLGVLLLALRYDISGSQQDYGHLMTAMETEQYYRLKPIMEEEKSFKTLLQCVPTNINEDGEGWQHISNHKDFMSSMMEEELPLRAICYTNDKVNYYNKSIYIDKFHKTGILNVGDITIGYNTIRKKSGREYIDSVINSEEYIVIDIEQTTHAWQYINKYDKKKAAAFPPYVFKVWKTRLRGSDNSESVVNIVMPSEYKRFAEVHANIYSTAQKHKWWDLYNEFCCEFLVMDTLNVKSAPKKALDQFYAMTCHKSQGSTFPCVYVDIPNIREAYNHYFSNAGLELSFRNQLARKYILRMLYVAISRASIKATLLL